jgi:RNA-directed DNA polymerase
VLYTQKPKQVNGFNFMQNWQNWSGGGDTRRVGKIQFVHSFQDIISIENLLEAWEEFAVGKRSKSDVQEFENHLMDNIIRLHIDLTDRLYRHGGYHAFRISDPKPRQIHKAAVRDRLLHHAVHRLFYPFFDKIFISDSFSCRLDKGTHAALNRFRGIAQKVGKNHTRMVWILKCDIRKFFASVDQTILLKQLFERIPDDDIRWLLAEIIGSFNSGRLGVGIPLGNLTSQLFANVYLNELDQFVKQDLRFPNYVRYADDFVFLSPHKNELLAILPIISDFIKSDLRLTMHPDKIILKTFASGVDFLGWTHFFDHRVLRKTTERRMIKRIAQHPSKETVRSYLGLLSHGNTRGLRSLIGEQLSDNRS